MSHLQHSAPQHTCSHLANTGNVTPHGCCSSSQLSRRLSRNRHVQQMTIGKTERCFIYSYICHNLDAKTGAASSASLFYGKATATHSADRSHNNEYRPNNHWTVRTRWPKLTMGGSPSGIAPGESLRAHVLISALTLEKRLGTGRQTDGQTPGSCFTPFCDGHTVGV